MVCIMCPSSVFLSLSKNTRDWKRPGQSYFHYKLDCRSHEKTFLPDLSWRARNFFHRDLGNLYSLLQLGVCGGFYNTLSRKKFTRSTKGPRAGNSDFDTQKSKMRFFCADLAKCQRSFYFHKSYLPEYLFLYFRRMFFSVLLLFDKSLMYKFFKSNPLSVEKNCTLFSLFPFWYFYFTSANRFHGVSLSLSPPFVELVTLTKNRRI